MDVDKILTLNKDDKIKKISFEEGLELLEEISEALESGGLPLDKSIALYEVSTKLVEHLRALLDRAEAKLKILEENNGDIVIKDE